MVNLVIGGLTLSQVESCQYAIYEEGAVETSARGFDA